MHAGFLNWNCKPPLTSQNDRQVSAKIGCRRSSLQSAVTDGDVLVYHYYDGNNNGNPALGLNLLGWTADGWPYVQ